MGKYLLKIRQLLRERRLPWAIKRRLTQEYIIMLMTKFSFKLVTATPPIRSFNDSDYEVCTLLDKGNVYAYLLAVKSFFAYSPVQCRITVVSDGSLQDRERRLLSKHVKGINIHDPFEIELTEDKLLVAMKAAREAYHTVRKTWDIFQAMKSKIIIFLDSDVIFLRRIHRWIFDINEKRYMIYNKDHDHSVCDPLFYLTGEFISEYNVPIHNRITDLNCGFMIFSSKAFKMDLIQRYIHFLYRRSTFHTVMEQDCWNIVASTVPSVAMPSTYVVGDYGSEFMKKLHEKDLISVHFVGGVRYKSLAYMKYALAFVKTFNKHREVKEAR